MPELDVDQLNADIDLVVAWNEQLRVQLERAAGRANQFYIEQQRLRLREQLLQSVVQAFVKEFQESLYGVCPICDRDLTLDWNPDEHSDDCPVKTLAEFYLYERDRRIAEERERIREAQIQ